MAHRDVGWSARRRTVTGQVDGVSLGKTRRDLCVIDIAVDQGEYPIGSSCGVTSALATTASLIAT